MKISPVTSTLTIAAALLFGPAPTLAQDYIVLVALRDTPAYEHALSVANDQTVFAERRLFRGLNKAAELLATPGPKTVKVLVAAGAYPGQLGSGTFVVPPLNNPEGSLQILGGFTDDFSGRQPFALLSRLVTAPGRDGAMLQMTQRSTLKELVISGLLFDAAPSNAYDAETNSILKAQSRTYPMISFLQLVTDHLVIADNIFINGAHGASDPYISPMSAATTIDIDNNFFLNTIKTMQPAGSSYRGNTVARINVRHNSFLLNWPFNPDATSSNVSALELYHRDGGREINIEGNIFAFNPGGALQHDWALDRMSDVTLQGNLFYMNGGLFGQGAQDAAVIAGKFGPSGVYRLIDLATMEDDLDYDGGGNVSMDPEINLAMAPLGAADSYGVERKNTVLNDIRRLFGLNQDGGTVAIANFAPKMAFDPDIVPLPRSEQAKGYGVQPGTLFGMN